MGPIIELSIRKDPWSGEYKVVWTTLSPTGMRRVDEDKTYYASDLEDAKATLTSIHNWASSRGFEVREPRRSG